jgi:hypothetical protein
LPASRLQIPRKTRPIPNLSEHIRTSPLTFSSASQTRLSARGRSAGREERRIGCSRRGLECLRGERDCNFASPLSSKALCLPGLHSLWERMHRVNSARWRDKYANAYSAGLSLRTSHNMLATSTNLSIKNDQFLLKNAKYSRRWGCLEQELPHFLRLALSIH